MNSFSEVKTFQVKPDKVDEFENLIKTIVEEQKIQCGCINAKYLKRFYIFDVIGELPRKLTKIVKCVRYYSFWEFDTIENYTAATNWFFKKYNKQINKCLIMPFEINCGDTLLY
ncbi:hypothetical protein I5677_14440 [Mobilitalea sibirica]|uniref:Uncharacterized protein n=1 Tax=Mobilitalea sibirica TaxID=1462919 RepID=A0A8J7HDI4_9FIRM|nr:hypothetical protein [Mobilitalea sibirica]MBH1942097.1 hypothetical protein [Mobilitalea sibirica]